MVGCGGDPAVTGCPGFCPCLNPLCFAWQRRRYTWRLGFFYKVWIFVACLGLLLTFVLSTLINGYSFFSNYRCGATAVSLLTINFTLMMALTGCMGLTALLLLRLLDMFGRFSLSDFMAVGKWMSRLGCLLKWAPWLFALLLILLCCFNIVNFTWILASPNNWCSRRWTTAGTTAVKNCRLWFRGTAQCLDASEKESVADDTRVKSCNDGEVLLAQRFFAFTPKDDSSSCSFTDILVCRGYKALVNGQTVDWSVSPLTGCTGIIEGSQPEDFQHSNQDSSDLYRYLSVYVQSWTWVTLCVFLFFIYLKVSTTFNAAFYQPEVRRKWVGFRFLGHMTPFAD